VSTKLQDVANQTVKGSALYPQSLGSGATNGTAVDMITGDGRCFAIQMAGGVGGTLPTLAGKFQESTDNFNVDTGTDVVGGAFTSVSAASNVQIISFDRTKRYLRYTGTVGGSATPTVLTSVFLGEQLKVL
jgi:hypothetical protein